MAELLHDPTVWALFVMREDYLAPLLPFAAMLATHLRTRYRLDLLTREQARQAMWGTAHAAAQERESKVGREFTEGALKMLADNLAECGCRIRTDRSPFRWASWDAN